MVRLTIKENPRIKANFMKALNEAIAYNKRLPAEICNSTLFFIVRNAIADTDFAGKGKIRNDLLAVSKLNPKAPIAAILVNKKRGQQGLKGLNGQQMSAAVEKFIKGRQSHSSFIRSRWGEANRIMQSATKYRAGAKRLPGGVKLGKGSGGAEPAKESWKTSGSIFAVINKVKNTETAIPILQKGLDKAVEEETRSKLDYVLRKKVQEGIVMFNRS